MARCRKKSKKLKSSLPATLTPRQVQILRLIHSYRVSSGCSPTMQEMADQLQLSKVTVFEHVVALEKKGVVLREPNRTRSLILNPETAFEFCEDMGVEGGGRASSSEENEGGEYPLAGSIAAGVPIETYELPDRLEVGHLFDTPEGTYALKVRGDSMIEDHICDEDYVLVRSTGQARNGEVVVAVLEDGQATLKRYYRESNRIRLQPANADYSPIYVKDVQIQGVVIGVIRCY